MNKVTSIADMVTPQAYKPGQSQYDSLIKLITEQAKQDPTQVDRDKQINDLNFVKSKFEKTGAGSDLQAAFYKAYESSAAIDTDAKKPVGVNYAQKGELAKFRLDLPQWFTDAMGWESSKEPLAGLIPILAAGQPLKKGGGIGLAAGVGGQLINFNLGKISGSLEKNNGTVNNYFDANDNIFTRSLNATGNEVGKYIPKISAMARANLLIEYFGGLWGVPQDASGGLSVNINPNARAEGNVGITVNGSKLNPKSYDGSYYAGGVGQASLETRGGVIVKKTTPTYFDFDPNVSGTAYGLATSKPEESGGKTFVGNLNISGKDATDPTIKKEQERFSVADIKKDSLVTLDSMNSSSSIKYFQTTGNGNGVVLKTGDSEGKELQNANLADKALSGRYTRLEDVVRWVNEVGKQNADNQSAVFQLVTADDLKKLNPNLVKELKVQDQNGASKTETVISNAPLVLPVVRDPDGILDIAKSAEVGGKKVFLKPRY